MDINYLFSNIDSFGCVIRTEDTSYLYIIDNRTLLEGMALYDNNEIYDTLLSNEIIIVGVSVKEPMVDELVDIKKINDDNYKELTYILTPLKYYTIKTKILTNDDLMDLELFDMLINSLVDGYLNNLENG